MNKVLLEGLKSLKPSIASGVANWGGKAYYFNEKDKAELLAEIEALEKPVKTLEEWADRVVDCNVFIEYIHDIIREDGITYNDCVVLFQDGRVGFESSDDRFFVIMNQELHAAIGQEMKKRGSWK